VGNAGQKLEQENILSYNPTGGEAEKKPEEGEEEEKKQ